MTALLAALAREGRWAAPAETGRAGRKGARREEYLGLAVTPGEAPSGRASGGPLRSLCLVSSLCPGRLRTAQDGPLCPCQSHNRGTSYSTCWPGGR